MWVALPPDHRTGLICGDTCFGHEALLNDCEVRRQTYQFLLRRSAEVKQLIRRLEQPGGW